MTSTSHSSDLTNPTPGNSAAGEKWHPFGYSPLVLILAAILIVLILPAVIYLGQASLHETNFDGSFGDFTFGYYIELVTGDQFINNLINALLYAVGSAVVAIGIGITLAWIVERTNTPFRHWVMVVSIVSLGIPSVLYTVSFLMLLGKVGPFNEFLMWVFSLDEPLLNVYSLWGMILIEGIEFAPLSFLLLSSVFRSNDASFEEASMMSGAGILQTFRNITLKLALPGILALVILIFIRAFESFETPALVGLPGNVSVLTTDIYESIEELPANYGQAGAFSVMLLLIVVVMLYGYNRLSRSAEKFQTITGKGFRPRVMDLGNWRWASCGVLALLFMIIIGFPIGIVMWVSLVPYFDGVSLEAIKLFSFDNYRTIAKAGSFRDALGNTVILGASTATIVAPFTALCAWLAVRRYKGAWMLDQLATAPLIFPAIVMGVAFLQLVLNMPFGLYGTLLSIIIASMVRYLPYGMRYSYAGILQIHTELEEASAMSGARQSTTFIRIVMPLVAPAMLTCWLFVFLVSVKAVSIPILLAGPRSQVVAIALFDMWENGITNELAALGMTWTAFMTVVSISFYWLAKRYGLTLR
ncbi:MAG: iron ABC transporter permease [Rhodospirillaceae bacterium]|nr:iron ABC transporter permease [Rhodospirillaceae bacterium]